MTDCLSNFISDDTNLISLIYFYDGVEFFDARHGSFHAFLLSVADLPPLCRNSFRNILTLSIIPGSVENIDSFTKYQMTAIDELLNSGI
jgi:hypothetical protein